MKIKTNRERLIAKIEKNPFRLMKDYHEKKCKEGDEKRKEKEARRQRLEVLPGVF